MTHDKHLATSLDNGPEDAWVSVIQKMDEAYADLVRYQVEVEEKNLELEENKQFFDSIQSSMSDVLIVCDHSGYIQRVNRGARIFNRQCGRIPYWDPFH